MNKLVTSEKHLNNVIRMDLFAIESNKAEKDRLWAISKLNKLKNKSLNENNINQTALGISYSRRN